MKRVSAQAEISSWVCETGLELSEKPHVIAFKFQPGVKYFPANFSCLMLYILPRLKFAM